MNLTQLAVKSQHYVKKNSPTILTCIGAVGVVSTAVSAIQSTKKAIDKLEQFEEPISKTEKALVLAPIYFPTVVLGAATITCIFGANTLNQKKQAMLTSAYAYLNTSFNEYKDKVKAIYGEDGEKRVREELARDKYVKQNIPESSEEMLFFDEYSGRYFETTLFDLQNAMYRLNRVFALEGYANLNDFYEYVNLPQIEYGAVLGWSGCKCWEVHNNSWIDIKWEDMEMADGLIAHAIHFPIPPEEDYENW